MGNHAVADIWAVIDTWVAAGGPIWLATESRSPQQHPAMGTLLKGMCICPVPPGQSSGSLLQNLAQRGTQQCWSFCHQPWPPRTHLTGGSQWRGTFGVPLPWSAAGGLPWRRDTPLGAEGGDGFWQKSMPKPSLNNSSEWVTWWADEVDTLTWWPELFTVPRERDVKEFARKIWALFELPERRSCAQSTSNDYSAFPPTCCGPELVPPNEGLAFQRPGL